MILMVLIGFLDVMCVNSGHFLYYLLG
jgi:hypothetical protein